MPEVLSKFSILSIILPPQAFDLAPLTKILMAVRLQAKLPYL